MAKLIGAVKVAEIFGVTIETVRQWRKSGILPYEQRKLPGQTRGRYMYPKDAIERLAKSSRRSVQPISSE